MATMLTRKDNKGMTVRELALELEKEVKRNPAFLDKPVTLSSEATTC